MKDAYAVATVVGRTPPVSSHLGDRAIVHANGRMEGFIGGSCSRDIVRRQALQAMRAGEPRLVRVRPDVREGFEERDTVVVPMSCMSEGAVDVYIEPHVPNRLLLLAGFTPVAEALANLAPALDFRVIRFLDERELREAGLGEDGYGFAIEALEEYLRDLEPEQRERSVAIAASQGHYDEPALIAFLTYGCGFTGLLASPRRGVAIADGLLQAGVPAERVRRIHHPVGLAIGARKPAEVAVSILAEVVAVSSGSKAAPGPAADSEPADDGAIDPVCGMHVAASETSHRASIGSSTYYFCCEHCRASFANDPERYLTAATPS